VIVDAHVIHTRSGDAGQHGVALFCRCRELSNRGEHAHPNVTHGSKTERVAFGGAS